MNIPYLGNLFKSTTVQNLRTELIMLMRPTVLPTPAVAALVATEERNKLSGVKQAEFEIRKDERERNAAIDAAMDADAAKQARKDAQKRHAPTTPTTPATPQNDDLMNQYEYLRLHPQGQNAATNAP